MSIKRNISNSIIFASVFVGTIVGAGISFITSSSSSKRVRERLKDAAGRLESDVKDQLQAVSVKVVEGSSRLEGVAREKIDEIKGLAQDVEKNFMEAFEAEKKKFSK